MPNTFGTEVDQNLFVELAATTIDGHLVAPRPPAGFTVKVRDDETLTVLTDRVTIDDNGSLPRWEEADGIEWVGLSVDSGVSWKGPFQSLESRQAAGRAGEDVLEAVNAATAAAASAATAQASADEAVAAVASRIPLTEKGAASGVATLDAGQKLTTTQIPPGLATMLTAYEAGEIGGAPFPQKYPFRWKGTDFSPGTSESIRIPIDAALSIGPEVELEPDIGTTDSTVIVETLAPGSSTWVNRYPTPITLPAGTKYMQAAPPASQSVPAGSRLRVSALLLPPGPTSSTDPVTQPVAATLYNSLTGSSASHAGPAVPAGATNDFVMHILSSNGASVPSLPTPWGPFLVDGTSNSTTPRAHAAIAFAPWSTSLPMSVSQAPGSPLISAAVLLRAVSSTAPIVQSAVTGANATTGGTFSTPGVTATAAADLVYTFAAVWYPALAEGWHLTPTGGPTGLTEIVDEVTTRTNGTTGITNYGLWVGSSGAVASGAAIPSVTLTLAGGTGSTGSVSWVTGLLTLRRASATPGPTQITVIPYLTAV